MAQHIHSHKHTHRPIPPLPLIQKNMPFDGHELAVMGTLTGCLQICNTHLGKGWFKMFFHLQPIAAASCVLFGFGVTYPLIAVPIRRALKLPTEQYCADHPNVTFSKYDI